MSEEKQLDLHELAWLHLHGVCKYVIRRIERKRVAGADDGINWVQVAPAPEPVAEMPSSSQSTKRIIIKRGLSAQNLQTGEMAALPDNVEDHHNAWRKNNRFDINGANNSSFVNRVVKQSKATALAPAPVPYEYKTRSRITPVPEPTDDSIAAYKLHLEEMLHTSQRNTRDPYGSRERSWDPAEIVPELEPLPPSEPWKTVIDIKDSDTAFKPSHIMKINQALKVREAAAETETRLETPVTAVTRSSVVHSEARSGGLLQLKPLQLKLFDSDNDSNGDGDGDGDGL